MNLDEALASHRILAVRGPNFSGRTRLLQDFCDAATHAAAHAATHERGRIYIGPEVYNALSGLAMSVRQEIELHAGAKLETCGIVASLQRLNLMDKLEQNPGLLSGGEQAALAVVCGLALQPANLAIDCALEQLDSHRLATAIAILNEGANPLHGTVITDNRMDEWDIDVAGVDIATVRNADPPSAPVPPIDPKPMARVPAFQNAPTVELRNLTAGYPKRPNVLQNLSVTLEPGRVHLLVGENGAGKSTCAKVLCGVLQPTAGQIMFAGSPAEPWKQPGKVVGYHLQNPDVGLFESTVLAEIGKTPLGEVLMEAFGLTGVADTNPLALPFPVRKRVSLAATICAGQPWMFLDEPTLGADSAGIAALAQIATGLAQSGRGVIVVSHSRTFRQQLAGREWVIDHGRVAAP